MKIVGCITEYNPFHNGHRYHIEEAKRITGADIAVAVMSGDFVQRGAPAFIDKYSRTEMALSCGADIVFELPVCYATGSAEYFALGAVSLLDKLGIVDYLCFGSECGEIANLNSLAEILTEEPEEYGLILNSLLREGKTYPAARMEAVRHFVPELADSVFSSPNNILGIEYIKALKRLESPIRPVTIRRRDAHYHAEELTPAKDDAISSATSIRKILRNGYSLKNVKQHVPKPAYDILEAGYGKTFPIFEDDYSLLLNYKLMQESMESLASYTDVRTDMANRIYRMDKSGLSFSKLAQQIKSRQWTLTRVNRALTHILLNLTARNFKSYNRSGYVQYARLLGLRTSCSSILRQIDKNRIPVITKLADAANDLSEEGLNMLNEDLFAAQLYNQVVFSKYGTVSKDEFRQGIVLF